MTAEDLAAELALLTIRHRDIAARMEAAIEKAMPPPSPMPSSLA